MLVSTPGRPMGELLRAELTANPANAPILPSARAAIDEFSYDPRRLVAGVKKPVLVVQGLRDLQVSKQDARLIHDADPGSGLVLLPALLSRLPEPEHEAVRLAANRRVEHLQAVIVIRVG